MSYNSDPVNEGSTALVRARYFDGAGEEVTPTSVTYTTYRRGEDLPIQAETTVEGASPFTPLEVLATNVRVPEGRRNIEYRVESEATLSDGRKVTGAFRFLVTNLKSK